MVLVADLLTRYNKQFVAPEVYLAASGEALVYILTLAWIITAIWERAFISDNPLLARLGYNNVCVAFDIKPARWVCAALYPIMSYFMIEYARTDLQRSYFQVLYGDITVRQWRFSAVTDVLLAGSACWFSLTFVISPEENVYWHSSGFISLIATRYLSLVANFTEAHDVSVASWVYLVINGITSSVYLAMLLMNYHHFDETGLPLWPGVLNGFIDYLWFFETYFTGRYLPDSSVWNLGRGTYSRMLDRRARQDLIRGRLQAPDEPPMIKQLDVQYNEPLSLQFSFRIMSVFGGAYWKDTFGMMQHRTSWLWSKSKDKGETCPWATDGTMYLSYNAVVEQLQKRAGLVQAGTHEKRNDLGEFRFSPNIFPRIEASQRAVIGEWFATHAQQPASGYKDRLAEVLNRTSLYVDAGDRNHCDLSKWCIQELVRASMPGREWTVTQAEQFLTHQGKGLTLGVFSYYTMGLSTYLEEKKKYISEIKEWVTQSGVADESKQDVIAFAIYASLMFAGGLSLSGISNSIVACRMNGFIPYGYKMKPEVAPRFVYEVCRNFPPVYATSVWDKKKNHQHLTCLATAGTDPQVWGHKFVVRPMSFYDSHGVNFNEKAGPGFMCPAKNLAIALMSELAMQFNPLLWKCEGAFQPEPEAHMIYPTAKPPVSNYWLCGTFLKLEKPRPCRDKGDWITNKMDQGDIDDVDLAMINAGQHTDPLFGAPKQVPSSALRTAGSTDDQGLELQLLAGESPQDSLVLVSDRDLYPQAL